VHEASVFSHRGFFFSRERPERSANAEAELAVSIPRKESDTATKHLSQAMIWPLLNRIGNKRSPAFVEPD